MYGRVGVINYVGFARARLNYANSNDCPLMYTSPHTSSYLHRACSLIKALLLPSPMIMGLDSRLIMVHVSITFTPHPSVDEAFSGSA